jgi:uridine kinase
MLIIGICGASGSGKTTLARELIARSGAAAGEDTILLHQDAYYKDWSHLSAEEREALDFDDPTKAFDHELFYKDITDLLKGRSITEKGYDFTRHVRADSGEIISPKSVLIVEGIHTFYEERLRELMDLRIFINVDPDICLLRRIERDIKDRGRTIDSISKQYISTVKPAYEKYIRHYDQYAHVVVSYGKDSNTDKTIIDMIAHYINAGHV